MESLARVCVVTSYPAVAEPRAPRHVIAATMAFPTSEVVFVDMAPRGTTNPCDPELLKDRRLRRITVEFPTRKSGISKLLLRKVKAAISRVAFARFGVLGEGVFGTTTLGLTRLLKTIPADVYIAHNIETLLPVMRAAETWGAAVVFDCMEYYSDMGEGQQTIDTAAAHALQAKYLPQCALVLASSGLMAKALSEEYGIRLPLAAYNVPPAAAELPARKGGGVNLYWRNSVIGFGQRGLEDALEALTLLPSHVRLYLQGRQTPESSAALAARVRELELSGRVNLLPPYLPHEAVQCAAPYDIGLCLERKGPRNHDLTVSNKMFDYHMAGLAVIATDLPALADTLNRSGGGLLCKPGDPTSLASAIKRIMSSPEYLAEFQSSARRFALETGNLDAEIHKITDALRQAVHPQTGA